MTVILKSTRQEDRKLEMVNSVQDLGKDEILILQEDISGVIKTIKIHLDSYSKIEIV